MKLPYSKRLLRVSKARSLVLSCVIGVAGCSSLTTHMTSFEGIEQQLSVSLEGVSTSYSGFCLGLGLIVHHVHNDPKSELMAKLGFFDMPMSAAMDTLFLPADLARDLFIYSKTGEFPDFLCQRL